MKILGIETSCDETAAAVVENGQDILSNVVVSQIDIFAEYGGVIPEVAARSHLEVINPVIDKALKDAHCTWDDIDAIAVTHAPGLLGSLLIGTLAARTLAILHQKPLYAVHHLKSHVYANWLRKEDDDMAGDASALARGFRSAAARSPLGTRERSEDGTPSALADRPLGRGRPGRVDGPDGRGPERSDASGPATSIAKACATNEPSLDATLTTEALDNTFSQQPAGASGHFDNGHEGETGVVYPAEHKDLARAAWELLSEGHAVPVPPLLALVISGGHTQILYMPAHNHFEIIGTTKDDAIGECFDKVAKILGLPYPGGPSIAKVAATGDPHRYHLPHPKVAELDFSFSGLKTAVLRAVQSELGLPISHPSHDLKNHLTPQQIADFAASFQRTAVDILLEKLKTALAKYPDVSSIVFAGGVSANQELRRAVTLQFGGFRSAATRSPLGTHERSEELARDSRGNESERRDPECSVTAYFPEPKFSGDNGAMVASAAYYEILSGVQPADPYSLDIYPRISIES